MSQALTRRSVVAAAPVFIAGAGTLSALANAAAPTEGIERLYANFLVAAAEHRRLNKVVEPYSEAVDLLLDDFSRRTGFTSSSDLWFREYLRLWKASGGDPHAIAANEQLEEVAKLAERIRAVPPKTIRDLVIKARVAQWDALLVPDRYQPEEDWDWNVLCLEQFIRDLEQFGGIVGAVPT